MHLRQMSSKKAMSTTTFSWIFMTIAGGVLIFFAYSLIQGYWTIEQETQQLEFAKALTNTFHITAQTLGIQSATTVDTFNMFSNKNIELVCIQGEFSRLNINNKEISYEPLNTYLDNFPLFMTYIDNEKPDSMFLIQEDYNFPHSITPLIGIVPAHHIIVINKSNELYNIINTLKKQKKSYNQINFLLYEPTNNPDAFINSLKDYSPTSIQFVNFNSNFIQSYVISKYSRNKNTLISSITISLDTLPSYIDTSNENKFISGTIEYTYSNNQKDFTITSQEDISTFSTSPKSFKFVQIRDEFSLPLFSLFSSPSNFECAHYSILKKMEFDSNFFDLKISNILISQDIEDTLNTTYCDSNLNSKTLGIFYKGMQNAFNSLYEDEENNFLINPPTQSFNAISIIDELTTKLRSESCEEVY